MYDMLLCTSDPTDWGKIRSSLRFTWLVVNQQNHTNATSTSLKLKPRYDPKSRDSTKADSSISQGLTKKSDYLDEENRMDAKVKHLTASTDTSNIETITQEEKDKDARPKLSPREEEEMVIIRQMYCSLLPSLILRLNYINTVDSDSLQKCFSSSSRYIDPYLTTPIVGASSISKHLTELLEKESKLCSTFLLF